VVDPGDDEVGVEAVDQAEGREAHAVHGGAVGGVPDAAVAEVDLLDPDRSAGGDRAGGGGAVGIGRDDGELDAGHLCERAPEGL